eukprot:XP_011664441.1 PREDICTED: uronyl 2-sulfotransferase isoform X2 [Strongylocentrotus purpuratus]
MFHRRPTVYTLLLLFALALVFLLVALHNDRTTDDRHGPIIHNDGVLNIQQKVLKFELRSKKGQRPSDDKPSKTLHASNGSEDSYLASSSNFSDDEVKERPSDLTGDNAGEVRVSSDDDDPQESEDDVDDDEEGGPVDAAPNHLRVLNAQARTKELQADEKQIEEEKAGQLKTEMGPKRRFLHAWDEYDKTAWKTLPLVTGLNQPETQTGAAIFYNRVGKCGSRSVIAVLRLLALKNQFHLVSSLTYNATRLVPEYEKMMVTVLSQIQKPYLFQRHVYFIDFRRYGVKQPKYINIIRDPLSRMVSHYYFQRFGDGKSSRNYSGKDKYQTFDACVLNLKKECFGGRTFYIIPYFCGQDPRCRDPSTWALNEAKQNVQDHFVAVGLLEELEDTFRVFETVLPDAFEGALDIYRNIVSGEVGKNLSVMVTKHKVQPSPEVARIMKDYMRLEYIFYEFIKTRFHTLKRELGIS